MNPITAFLVDNIIAVFFFYGLAFFIMGVALALAGRQESEMHFFVQAIRPLAYFGILHGIHEWVEMFQRMALAQNGRAATPVEELLRVLLLAASFVMLVLFGLSLLTGKPLRDRAVWGPTALLSAGWAVSALIAVAIWRPDLAGADRMADVLARYWLAIPGSLLGAWALMHQQRDFRARGMSRFGRDLVWAAAALLLYGAVGQLFAPQSPLFPSTVVNSRLFLAWFGVPVQLFRGLMAVVLMVYVIRALGAVGFESRQRVVEANRRQLEAQQRALDAERRVRQERERLNQELEERAKELALLLDLSNLLAAPADLPGVLARTLQLAVRSLTFSDAGLIMLARAGEEEPLVEAMTGFATTDPVVPGARFPQCVEMGRLCITENTPICRHLDGSLVRFDLEGVMTGRDCWAYHSPSVVVALPLATHGEQLGAVVFARSKGDEHAVSLPEMKLMAGIARQLGVSIQNTQLTHLAQERERMLGDLLNQVVGAQEAERQRIARELHDATAQSLSAIAMGLRGIANSVQEQAPAAHAHLTAVQTFATEALDELRRIMADLRPPQLDDLGLSATLRWYVGAFQQRNPHIDASLQVIGSVARLPASRETALFRVVQEALTNIAKHAGATRASVLVEMKPTRLVVTVQDNGRGFDPARVLSRRDGTPSWGLLGMRERTLLLGGDYEIKSAPGQGTLVRVSVPVAKEETPVRG